MCWTCSTCGWDKKYIQKFSWKIRSETNCFWDLGFTRTVCHRMSYDFAKQNKKYYLHCICGCLRFLFPVGSCSTKYLCSMWIFHLSSIFELAVLICSCINVFLFICSFISALCIRSKSASGHCCQKNYLFYFYTVCLSLVKVQPFNLCSMLCTAISFCNLCRIHFNT